MKRAAAAPAFGPPGAAPTDSANLLHGVYASCTINGITTLHLFDWELQFRQALVDVSGYGDEWEQWKPVRQGFTLRARGYMTRSAAATATYWGGGTLDIGSPGAEQTINCYSDMGTTIVFTGTGYAEDVSMSAPQAMVEQEITIRGNAAPSAGPTA